jgi:predicted ATPase
MALPHRARFLQRVSIVESRVPAYDVWPYSIPFVRGLSLPFKRAVTFFVGENGSGKSTLLESIADACELPVSGGGKNEGADKHGPEAQSALGRALRPAFTERPRDAYFFRAEFQAHFASLLDQRRADPDFWGDPYARYGGKSLHARSHGEAFLALLLNRMESGLFLMDEPESALSPQRQLTLLTRMAELVKAGKTQLIIATHSPILLTFPDAEIVGFDGGVLAPVRLEDTSHYQITKGILEAPERYWRMLTGERSRPSDDE